MQRFWVPARKTLSLVTSSLESDHGAMIAICERAHAGLIRSKAELLLVGTERRDNALIPAEFWWAEGHEALQQDWMRGDFSTWIDRKVELKAFGTYFDFEGIRSMLSPQSAAAAAREMSVASDPQWVSASEARQFAYENLRVNPMCAGEPIIDQCRLGFLPAKAVLMQRRKTSPGGASDMEVREWNIPIWFWERFTSADSSQQDWSRGVFSGRGRTPEGLAHITLTGVFFQRTALQSMAPSQPGQPPEAPSNKGGRPRKEWWDDLWCAVWGRVFRGELIPKSQADIERAMLEWVEDRGEAVAESTVKPLARKMYLEMQRGDEN